ncbi:hypothetical protein TA3x_003961 [Tundrisphaera sp. TA3]|uniref:hypothetical protein n=1 Tax=Tundrisphaera sp. TA3 TaxID=3435775 RepID=UPI003EBAA309
MPGPNRTPDDPQPIADAASFFQPEERPAPPPAPRGGADFGTDEIRVVDWIADPDPTPAAPARPPAPAPSPPGDDEYGLIGGPPEVAEEEPPPRPVDLPKPEKRVRRPVEPEPAEPRAKRPYDEIEEEPSPPRRRRKGAEVQSEEDAEADPLWTRWAEVNGTVMRIAAAVAGVIFVAYLLTYVAWPLVFFWLMIGFPAAALLSYPILITMERPVRITPEQAVKDFYAAASHHFPHYKRMWLLLSSAGRDAGPFRSFADFRSAWERKVAAWKGTRVKKYAPLEFQVQDFRADKSVGQSSVWAEYTLRIRPRDEASGETLATIRMAHGLVKGEDRMWYLNRGLPDAADGD